MRRRSIRAPLWVSWAICSASSYTRTHLFIEVATAFKSCNRVVTNEPQRTYGGFRKMATTEVRVAPEHVRKSSQGDVRKPDPIVVVIFGASGDLTKRKLLPALFHLEQAGLLPQEFSIVGVARRPLEDSFAADMKDGILKF